MTDLDLVIRDKYGGDASRLTQEDRDRLDSGEPLSYVIGWAPFLELHIDLSSRPLIPRPETEWWTELLIQRLKDEHGEEPFTLLDICAGSGAIGLCVLSAFRNAHVELGELERAHCEQIRKNIELNGLDETRADILLSDTFEAFRSMTFDHVVANPPYIPAERILEESVSSFEPLEALYSGKDGMDVIRRIAADAASVVRSGGSLWLEADTGNIEAAGELLAARGAKRIEILTDLCDRQRVVVAYY